MPYPEMMIHGMRAELRSLGSRKQKRLKPSMKRSKTPTVP